MVRQKLVPVVAAWVGEGVALACAYERMLQRESAVATAAPMRMVAAAEVDQARQPTWPSGIAASVFDVAVATLAAVASFDAAVAAAGRWAAIVVALAASQCEEGRMDSFWCV